MITTAILLQLLTVFTIRSEEMYNFQNAWRKIVRNNPTIYIAVDRSKMAGIAEGIMEIYTTETTLKNYGRAQMNDGTVYNQTNGVRRFDFNLTIDKIEGYVKYFNYTLACERENPQFGWMTYTFDKYVFRVNCTLKKNRFCLDKCTDSKAMSNGVFTPQFKYKSMRNNCSSLNDVYTAFKSTEIYKVNKNLGNLINKGFSTYSECL